MELRAGKEGGKCVVSLFSFTSLSLWREESEETMKAQKNGT